MRHSILTWLSFAATLILGASPALADFTKSDMAPPPQEVVDLVTRDKECHLYEGTNPLDMWEGTTLSSDVRVHLLPCFMGAYNLASIVVIEYRGEAEPASTYTQQFFASYGADYGWVGSSTLTNAFISPETGHLVHFHKGRGLGDCGTTGEWDWNGYIFAMVEYRVQEECNGTAPDQWPVLYTRITADPETPDVAADCSVAPYCEDRDYFVGARDNQPLGSSLRSTTNSGSSVLSTTDSWDRHLSRQHPTSTEPCPGGGRNRAGS